jgi:hypothetical protein
MTTASNSNGDDLKIVLENKNFKASIFPDSIGFMMINSMDFILIGH